MRAGLLLKEGLPMLCYSRNGKIAAEGRKTLWR